jgi:hypothetical protein
MPVRLLIIYYDLFIFICIGLPSGTYEQKRVNLLDAAPAFITSKIEECVFKVKENI